MNMIFTSGDCVNALIVIQIVVILASTVNCQSDGEWKQSNFTGIERLRMQLFMNYDKGTVPMESPMRNTNISLGLSLQYIDINEFNGKLTLYGWVLLRWTDVERTWSPDSYDNISRLHLNPNVVWRPSVNLLNNAQYESDYVGDSYVILLNNGTFIWAPHVKYTTYCNMNLKLWPYDTQYCNLKITAWSLIQIEPMFLAHEDAIQKDFVQSAKWAIIDVKAEYHVTQLQNFIEYEFQLKRRNAIYSVIIFTPASSIVLLTLCTFWLPPRMGEKIFLNGILIAVTAAFLMFYGQEVSTMSSSTPLVVLFYGAILIMLSVSTVVAAVVLHLSTAKHTRGVIKFFRNVLNGSLGQVLLLTQFTVDDEQPTDLQSIKEEHYYDNTAQEDNSTTDLATLNTVGEDLRNSNQLDWLLLAVAIDRLCFAIFGLAFLVLAIMYIL